MQDFCCFVSREWPGHSRMKQTEARQVPGIEVQYRSISVQSQLRMVVDQQGNAPEQVFEAPGGARIRGPRLGRVTAAPQHGSGRTVA